MHRVLLVVDVQRDFCEDGGSLPVPGSLDAIQGINGLIAEAGRRGDLILYTKDWHPDQPEDDHFEEFPPHCVANTIGADFHPRLTIGSNVQQVFFKGLDGTASFSAFDGQNQYGVSLDRFLIDNEVDRIDVCGLATDYCVYETAMDAKATGYDVRVMLEGCAGVTQEGIETALRNMLDAGIALVSPARMQESLTGS